MARARVELIAPSGERIDITGQQKPYILECPPWLAALQLERIRCEAERASVQRLVSNVLGTVCR